MPTNYYDVVVVGHELATVVAGALLARRGFRVLWIGDGDAHEIYTWDDLEMPAEPFVFVGLERPATRRVLGETALGQVLKRRLVSCRPPFQVVLPKLRMDVGETDVLAREIDREFSDDRLAVTAAFGRVAEIDARLDTLLDLEITLPPQSFWERRDVARTNIDPRRGDALETFADDHPLRRVFATIGTVGSDLDPQNLPAALAARLYTTWRRGTARLAGGRRGLREIFLDKIASVSGELQPRMEGGHITLRRGKVEGFCPRGRREPFGCGAVIVDSMARAVELCEGLEQPKALKSAMDSVSVAYQRYTLNLVVPVEAVPEGMGPIVVVSDDVGPAPRNVFLLCASDPDGKGRVVLTVSCLVTNLNQAAEERSALLSAVSRVVPFLEENLLLAHSPHDNLPALGRLAESGPPPMQWPMRPVFHVDAPAWGVAGFPYATGWKNIYAASRGTLPALGLEGEFATAWGLARILTMSEGKRDVLKRRAVWSS